MQPPVFGRIVVIDDNRDLADVFGSLFELLGYRVKVAYSGAEGLRAYQDFFPQVVFSDINMPEMSGIDVAKAIRLNPRLPLPLLVAVTAQSGLEIANQAISAGFNKYLCKPVDLEDITILLRDHFGS